MTTMFMQTFVSVDCVVFGFDGNQLNVLLVQRNTPGPLGKTLKLPGSLIYQQEDADSAAGRVLKELTGIHKMSLKQFKCFTSPERTSNKEDVLWLEIAYHNKVDRLITIVYLSLCKINKKLNITSEYNTVEWCSLSKLPNLPFDHNIIVNEALKEIRDWVEKEPSILFELLPVKFTAVELLRLYEAIYNRKYDVRNFHKKMGGMEYVHPLEEKQINVAHRAARYYKFDRKRYKRRKVKK